MAGEQKGDERAMNMAEGGERLMREALGPVGSGAGWAGRGGEDSK